MKQILLVEDDESLNRGISLKLTKEGHHVRTAFTIAQAKEQWAAQPPDLIICDIGLPDGSGLDFCQMVRAASDVYFVLLTARDTETDIVQGYDVGADDYITKPFSLMVLISKVNAILGRVKNSAPQTIRSGRLALLPAEKRVYKDERELSLTPNEWRMLLLFFQHPRHILSKQQLLDTLWDADSEFCDENTVAVNIRRLREKIEDNPSAPCYIKNVRGMGYRWDMECEGK